MSVAINWLEQADFLCDVTKEQCNYSDIDVVWYDASAEQDEKTILFQDHFMLIKHGTRLKNHLDSGWTLNVRSLRDIVKRGGVILFFTDLLVVDSIHDRGNYLKQTNIQSWTVLFRRLTIPGYEKARFRLREAKQMEDFFELTEFQLLQPETLERFLESLL